MTKVSRKLLLSIFTLVLTVVALGTTTFAWFALSPTAQLNSFDVEVQGATGLELRVGGTGANSSGWKTTLLASDIYKVIRSDASDRATGPVLKDLTLQAGETALKTLAGTTPTLNKDYLSIDIEMRSPNYDEVYWTDIFLDSEEKEFAVDVAFTDAFGGPVSNLDGDIIETKAIYAARVSIADQALVNPVSMKIHEMPAVDSVNTFTGAATDQTTNIDYGAISYYKAKNDRVPGSATGTPTVLPTFALPATANLSVDNDQIGGEDAQRLVCKLVTTEGTSYLMGKITVRVWLEGWDRDCYNAILTAVGAEFNDFFKASFKFAGKDSTIVTP